MFVLAGHRHHWGTNVLGSSSTRTLAEIQRNIKKQTSRIIVDVTHPVPAPKQCFGETLGGQQALRVHHGAPITRRRVFIVLVLREIMLEEVKPAFQTFCEKIRDLLRFGGEAHWSLDANFVANSCKFMVHSLSQLSTVFVFFWAWCLIFFECFRKDLLMDASSKIVRDDIAARKELRVKNMTRKPYLVCIKPLLNYGAWHLATTPWTIHRSTLNLSFYTPASNWGWKQQWNQSGSSSTGTGPIKTMCQYLGLTSFG